MNSVHGKAMNSKKTKDGCPTHEDPEFPDSMRVQIQVVHTNPGNARPQDVRNRSLSPWDYRINEDPNRFPIAIAEASCRHSACVHASGRGLNYSLSSVPIQQEILVLRRKRIGCRQTYWLEKQMVTVGCTCAFPTTHTYTNLGKDGRDYGDLTRTGEGPKQ
ncbi:UNVERIFIED_CONTAM: hypothetical protein K2H54_039702 [Gekko kuhli]